MYGEITSYKVFDSACSTVSAASPEANGFDPEERIHGPPASGSQRY